MFQNQIAGITFRLLKGRIGVAKVGQQIRHGSAGRPMYRGIPYEGGEAPDWRTKLIHGAKHGLGIFLWYWLSMQIWYGYDHHWRGRRVLKNPRLYTDEELGIPPDDADGEAFPGMDITKEEAKLYRKRTITEWPEHNMDYWWR